MRQYIALDIAAVRRVEVPFAYVIGKLGSNVTKRSVASHYKSAIHAKFGSHGFANAKFSGSIPHQLGEMTRLVLISLIVEIVTAYFIIPGA